MQCSALTPHSKLISIPTCDLQSERRGLCWARYSSDRCYCPSSSNALKQDFLHKKSNIQHFNATPMTCIVVLGTLLSITLAFLQGFFSETGGGFAEVCAPVSDITVIPLKCWNTDWAVNKVIQNFNIYPMACILVLVTIIPTTLAYPHGGIRWPGCKVVMLVSDVTLHTK